MTHQATDLPLGTIVAGRFRLEAVLGTGGYGAVYAATQLNLGRRVALKLLHPHVFARSDARARFEREARVAQHLSHPNNVRLLDFGSTDDGHAFIVWEILEGRSLDVEIARGAFASARAWRVGSQVLKALAEAHALGIVHRDIKPANIFLCDFAGEIDFVKVLDYGIAKSTKEEASGLTLKGVVLGTASYMSPEQVRGETVDPRTDLYSLGLVLSEMVSGEPVFRGASALDVATKQLSPDPVPHPDTTRSSALFSLIARATEKDRERRFSSAHEMLAAMQSNEAPLGGSGSGPRVVIVPSPSTVERVFDVTVLPNHATRSSIESSATHAAFQLPAFPLTQPSPQPRWPEPVAPSPVQPSTSAPAPMLTAEQPIPLMQHAQHAPAQRASTRTTEQLTARASSRVWLAALGVVALFAIAAGLFAMLRALDASEDRETKERRAKKDTDEPKELDYEGLAFDYVKMGMQNPKKPCRPIDKDLASWHVHGVTLDALITRAERAKYTCKRHVVVGSRGFYEFEKPGDGRVIAMQYQDLVNVLQKAPGSRTITDERSKHSLTVVANDGSVKAANAFADALAE